MGILPEVSIVSIYPCVIPVEAYRGGGCRADDLISKRTPHSLDREDHQDFVIRCRQFNEHSQYSILCIILRINQIILSVGMISLNIKWNTNGESFLSSND